MIGPNTPAHFTPSSWNLERQIAAALQKCDASVEQARLKSAAQALIESAHAEILADLEEGK